MYQPQPHTLRAVTESLCGTLDLDESEIALDAHIYTDLGCESLDVMDVLFRMERMLEIDLDLRVLNGSIMNSATSYRGDEKWDRLRELQGNNKPANDRESDLWDIYVNVANEAAEVFLERAGFSQDVTDRFKEMRVFCEERCVKMFSVGFLCAWIEAAASAPENRGPKFGNW